MTELLFYANAYLKNCEAQVVTADERGIVLVRDQIEVRLNQLIGGNYEVTPKWITDEELADRPELVKTMSVKPPMGMGRVRLLEIAGVDLQACGGTHVSNTAEIGRVQVVKIENKGTHNRRVTVALATHLSPTRSP